MIARNDILLTARTYLGAIWRHQGRDINGMDCLGLILRVAWDLGIPADDDRTYTRTGDRTVLEAACAAQLVPIALDEARPGDILQLVDKRSPVHLAILADLGYPYSLIHAVTHWGKVVEHGYQPPWPTMTVGAWSYPGVAPWEGT